MKVEHPKCLLDAAFEPRTFTITMEKGNFSHQDEYSWRCYYAKERWGFRLVFDKSPYPAPEAWNRDEAGSCRYEVFEHRNIAVAKVLPDCAADVKPMEDDTFMGSMVGDSYARARTGVGCTMS